MTTGPASMKPWQTARNVGIVLMFFGGIAVLANPSDSPERYVPVGTVQSIRFFGSLGVQTQVDTRDAEGSERSFVVDRVSHLHKGQAVLLHAGRWGSELCNVERTICEDLIGSPQ